MARPKKSKARKAKEKSKADPKKRTRKNPKSRAAPALKISKRRTPPKAVRTPARKAAPKATRKAAQPAQKGPRKRDYRKEYQRRVERARALGYPKSVARGHARKDRGEVGREELSQMRRAVHVLSPGQQRKVGIKRPVTSHLRTTTRERVAEVAGVELPTNKIDATKRTTDAKRFAETFLALGLGSKSQAYTLWFSP